MKYTTTAIVNSSKTEQASFSSLKLKILGAELDFQPDDAMSSKTIVYRDFDRSEHRDNFVNGNIWFSGPNQNRFFLKSSRQDPTEYKNSIASFIYEYSLSFSTVQPDKNRPAIKISDVKGFITAIKNDLEQMTNNHTVTWLPLKELRWFTCCVPTISAIAEPPIQDGETITLSILGIGGAEVKYVTKIGPLNNSHDSKTAANNARDKNVNYSDEKEWRISLSTGDFSKGRCLQHLVQYLKFSTPNISEFCELIN